MSVGPNGEPPAGLRGTPLVDKDVRKTYFSSYSQSGKLFSAHSGVGILGGTSKRSQSNVVSIHDGEGQTQLHT